MSTISNERLESLQRQFKEEGFNDISDSEIMQLVEENLALRKERERAEPVAWLVCGSKTFKDRTASTREVAEQAVKDRKDGSSIKPLYTAQQLESLASVKQPSSNLAATGQASRDSDANSSPDSQTTIKQPDGWKLVPIELTKEMRRKIHPFAEALCLGCGRQVVADCVDNVTASWNDMLAAAPEPCK